MLDQEKTGKYIAEKRKQLNMTQKQLAERVGITDKAVSKWERGKSIPDSAVMEELCGVLQISMNEFFSGEDIREENYSQKAEENIRALAEQSDAQKKRSRIVYVSLTVGLIGILFGLRGTFLYTNERHTLYHYIDFPSLFFLLGIVAVVLAVCGLMEDFVKAFVICFRKKETDREQAGKSVRAVKTALILNLMAGVFIFLAQAIVALPATPGEDLLKTVATLLVGFWYGVLFDLLLMPVLFRCMRQL
ncbi:MAG: helix-turn-helix domain-containing protein [Blautia sp.]|nr:helix-turn-helix domain-containing protein [Blautia sp.]